MSVAQAQQRGPPGTDAGGDAALALREERQKQRRLDKRDAAPRPTTTRRMRAITGPETASILSRQLPRRSLACGSDNSTRVRRCRGIAARQLSNGKPPVFWLDPASKLRDTSLSNLTLSRVTSYAHSVKTVRESFLLQVASLGLG